MGHRRCDRSTLDYGWCLADGGSGFIGLRLGCILGAIGVGLNGRSAWRSLDRGMVGVLGGSFVGGRGFRSLGFVADLRAVGDRAHEPAVVAVRAADPVTVGSLGDR